MSKKIISITEQELINAINAEGLGNGHPYESELCMHGGNDAYKKIQLPGAIGITRSANDRYHLVYVVDADGKMGKFSSHNTREEAYGMALRRYREAAAASGCVKTEGNSFAFGPVSSWRDGENDRYVNYRRQKLAEYKESKNLPTVKQGRANGIRYVMTSVRYDEKQGVKNPFDLNDLLIQYSYLGADEFHANKVLHAYYGYEAAKDLTGSYMEILKALNTKVSKLKVGMYPGGISLRFRTSADTAFDVDSVLAPAVSQAMDIAASL